MCSRVWAILRRFLWDGTPSKQLQVVNDKNIFLLRFNKKSFKRFCIRWDQECVSNISWIQQVSAFRYNNLHIYFLCYNNYFSLRNSPSSRIHTLSGYAFAGSENIAMMVINDNPIKTIDSFAFAGLKNVKFLLISSSVRHLHKVTKYIRIKPDQIKSMFRTSNKYKLNSVNEIWL